MTERIKFTVIIPTRERADTLYHCLRTVVEQDYDELTIIVSDNFSQDNTREIVESFSDRRIKYINTGSRISMSHNWEFALSHVTDGWVTFLGDDDGMLPGALERITEVAAATGVSAVTSKWNFYFWPQSTGFENQLTVSITSGYEIRNCQKWLRKLMRGNASYQELPYVYTGGFVDIRLINRARREDGCFFCSMTPDVYSAIALASIVDDYAMLHEPVCVMGVSVHSNGSSQFGLGKSQGPVLKFYSENNIPFHESLGSNTVKSIPIITYESYLQASHLHNDILKVDMVEQLGLALATSSDEYRTELKKYCDEVALRNGVDLKAVEICISKRNPKIISRLLSFAVTYWNELCVDSAKYSVKNVYGAAMLSHVLYKFNRHDKNWRLINMKKLVLKIWSRLWRFLKR
jgi:glycosyltransferase involved in cell wall biosynthesis